MKVFLEESERKMMEACALSVDILRGHRVPTAADVVGHVAEAVCMALGRPLLPGCVLVAEELDS